MRQHYRFAVALFSLVAFCYQNRWLGHVHLSRAGFQSYSSSPYLRAIGPSQGLVNHALGHRACFLWSCSVNTYCSVLV